MRTSEVLNRAADLIEERGWVQGSAGWPGHHLNEGALCLEGGIMAALGMNWQQTLHDIHDLNTCPAYRAVADHISRHKLFAWNDTTGRTAAEVIEVLRATAIIEAAKEDDAIAAEFLTWQGSEISA